MRAKLLAIGVLLAGPLLWTLPANATPVAAGSELSLEGYADLNSTNTTIDFLSASSTSIDGETGSFTELGSNGTVVFENEGTYINYTTLTSGSNLSCGSGCIFTATNGDKAATFDLTNETVSKTGDTLTIFGTGTIDLTGFDPTVGTFELTTQLIDGAETNISFSTTTTAVPEPGSFAILSIALAGLGLVVRHRRRIV